MARGLGRGSHSGRRGSQSGGRGSQSGGLDSQSATLSSPPDVPSPPAVPSAVDIIPNPVEVNNPPRPPTSSRMVISLEKGKIHLENFHAKVISKTFKIRLDIEGHNWKSVTQIFKEFYWEEFKKETLGRDPYPREILEKTHMRKSDTTFVNAKSKEIYDRVVTRISSENAAAISDTNTGELVDATKIYFEEVGGMQKQRIYGLGSVASYYVPQDASTTSALSHTPQGEQASQFDRSEVDALKEQVKQQQMQIDALKEELGKQPMLEKKLADQETKIEQLMCSFSSSNATPATDSVHLSSSDI